MYKEGIIYFAKQFGEMLLTLGVVVSTMVGIWMGIVPLFYPADVIGSVGKNYQLYCAIWWAGVLCCYLFLMFLEKAEADKEMTQLKWDAFSTVIAVMTSWYGLVLMLGISVMVHNREKIRLEKEFEDRIRGGAGAWDDSLIDDPRAAAYHAKLAKQTAGVHNNAIFKPVTRSGNGIPNFRVI